MAITSTDGREIPERGYFRSLPVHLFRIQSVMSFDGIEPLHLKDSASKGVPSSEGMSGHSDSSEFMNPLHHLKCTEMMVRFTLTSGLIGFQHPVLMDCCPNHGLPFDRLRMNGDMLKPCDFFRSC